MKKSILIALLGITLMYGPGMIARAIEEKPASQVIWEMYCEKNGIDPGNPTEEQENYYLDVYIETDEYCELYDFLTTTKNS